MTTPAREIERHAVSGFALQVDVQLEARSRGRRFALPVRFASSRPRIVLFGPSGVGKSLTLQAIAGLVRPRSGRIALGDRVLFDSTAAIDRPARQRQLGYVFQDYALFPHLDVAHNIAFGTLGIFRRSLPAQTRADVARMAEALGIGHLLDSRPATLSGGQRQRVALARALLRPPQLLLLDEPFAALDIALRSRVRDELDTLRLRHAVPLVLITHDIEDVRRFADTLVLLGPDGVAQVAHRDEADVVALAERFAADTTG